MKTHKGIETYGCFHLGHDEAFTQMLYASLFSDEMVSVDLVIIIDLVGRENDVPFPQELRHCSYEQLSNNVRMITKEVFKRLNLEI
ncbi:hypothetical protein [Pedobacter sp. UYP1]|uniref:hypothetical protein n=1 Tax=Pedobacter sp. UYP1 TaxID=1756396 RepID=UPI0033971856